MKAILRAQQIEHQFQEQNILNGIDLSVFEAEILGIFGDSGAGKTTLLRILAGLLKPNKGSVFFQEQNLNELNEKAKALFRNRHMGFVDQFHRLLPELNVEENIALPYWIGHTQNIKIPTKVSELLAYLGLSDKKKAMPHELSGGQQQRVAIARALVNEPALLFADEPSGHLDSKNAAQIYALFEQLKRDLKVGIVIVTHNEAWKSQMDRYIHLQDGKIQLSTQ